MKAVYIFFLSLLLVCEVDAQCYTVTQSTYQLDSLSAPTYVTLMDDQYSGLLPIGFPFCFYGATYDSLVIGSNGVVSFDPQQAGAYCQWPVVGAIPTSSDPMNAIYAPWMDLAPMQGGAISYQTTGVSPNREFIVYYNAVTVYSCTTNVFTGQIKLYETTNNIEIKFPQKQLCAQWNGGYAIEGIQNAPGTMATVVPGRNYPTQWTTTNDSWLFTPTCNVCTGVGISEPQHSEISLFVSDHNEINIIPNDQAYKLLSVYNTLGQEVKFTQTGNTISLAEASAGIYIVNLEINGVRVAKKLMMN